MDDEIAEIVRKHGWYAADVNGDPPFMYTIGLMTCAHPEIIVFDFCSFAPEMAEAAESALPVAHGGS